MVAVLFIVFLVALAIGVPVAFSLGLASVAYMLGAHIQMINFAQYFFKGLDSFTLLCIPGFTFAGNLMNQGGISEKLLDFADALVGHITGGLAYANVLASMVFAGISGTALSDNSKDISLFNVNGNILQHLKAAKLFAYMFNIDHKILLI